MQTKFLLILKLWAVAMLAAFALNLQTALAAPTQTFVVNVTDDTDDGNCNAGHCSLREAINAANFFIGVTDNIHFNIARGAGKCDTIGNRCRITVTSALPDITNPVVIDGFTQPETSANTLAVGNDAVYRIILLDSANQSKTGLRILGGGTTIRGIVLENFHTAIHIQSNNNRIEGNFIGVDSTGDVADGNYEGVLIHQGDGNIVGGMAPAARNLISGNSGYGISISASVGNKVLGNYIGTNRAGTAALGNHFGVGISEADGSVIGKGSKGRNLISGNLTGVILYGDSDGNRVQNNLIGVAADGTTPLGNTANGLIFAESTPGNVPDSNILRKNRIRHNGIDGIAVLDGTGNAFSRNSISENGGMGIDLGPDGLTLNDNKDADSGANDLQNFPSLEGFKQVNGQWLITGTFKSRKNKNYRIEVFGNTQCDLIGGFNYGEGATYLGAVNVTTDKKGKASFQLVTGKSLSNGVMLSATATVVQSGKLSSTSEFSRCLGGL